LLMAKGWRALVLVVVVAFAVEIAQTSPGHALLQKAGLVKAPNYTALSFVQPQLLPTQLPARHSSVNVSFVIRNATASPHAYNWQVQLVRGKRTTSAASARTLVPAGASTIVANTIRTSCVGGKIDFVIKLAVPAESINFRSACRPRGGGSS
jgi:hypothetical protein